MGQHLLLVDSKSVQVKYGFTSIQIRSTSLLKKIGNRINLGRQDLYTNIHSSIYEILSKFIKKMGKYDLGHKNGLNIKTYFKLLLVPTPVWFPAECLMDTACLVFLVASYYVLQWHFVKYIAQTKRLMNFV